MPLIYIVEDDTSIRELEAYALKGNGFDVSHFERPSDFYNALEHREPDLILLDIMLPEEDGLSILSKIKSNPRTSKIPIILITAKTTELDTVKGLDSGADDYIAKPFGVMEMISRVKAALRRVQGNTPKKTHTVGCITLDEEKHTITSDGNSVDLTYKEFELLKYLMINLNIVLSREKIMNAIWEYDFESENRTVDVHIQTLRKKLGRCGNQIKTIRNVGYKMTEAVE